MKKFKYLGLIAILFSSAAQAEYLYVKRAPDLSTSIQITAYLDGSPRQFQLDTGASQTLIKPDEQSLNYPKLGTTPNTGATGETVICDLVQIPEINVAEFSQLNKKVARCDLGNASYNNLGIDALEGQIWSFNFSRYQLSKIDGIPNSLRTSKLRKYNLGHRALEINLGGIALHGIFDTGAQISSVDLKYIKDHNSLFTYIGRQDGTDVNQKPLVLELYSTSSLRIGGEEFQDVVLVAFDFGTGLRTYFGDDAPIIIGNNIITNANWILDLKNNQWAISGLRE